MNRSDLEQHALEEETHIALWTDFASALGVSRAELASSRVNRSTTALLAQGDEFSGLPFGAAVSWALEVQTPAVSVEKLRGLAKFYGIDASNGGQYFDVHSCRDLVHAEELNSVLADLTEVQLQAAQLTADMITNRLWDVLSSVEHAA